MSISKPYEIHTVPYLGFRIKFCFYDEVPSDDYLNSQKHTVSYRLFTYGLLKYVFVSNCGIRGLHLRFKNPNSCRFICGKGLFLEQIALMATALHPEIFDEAPKEPFIRAFVARVTADRAKRQLKAKSMSTGSDLSGEPRASTQPSVICPPEPTSSRDEGFSLKRPDSAATIRPDGIEAPVSPAPAPEPGRSSPSIDISTTPKLSRTASSSGPAQLAQDGRPVTADRLSEKPARTAASDQAQNVGEKASLGHIRNSSSTSSGSSSRGRLRRRFTRSTPALRAEVQKEDIAMPPLPPLNAVSVTPLAGEEKPFWRGFMNMFSAKEMRVY
jgi:hypothetical protein